MAHENMTKYLDGKEPKKVIVVHKKIVNVVVQPIIKNIVLGLV